MDEPQKLPLRDIHLPDPVSWWPMAPGWWIVIVLACLLAGIAVWRYRKHRLNRLSAIFLAKSRLNELREQYLEHKDVSVLAREISILLRRLSISAFPRKETASLTGTAWLQHLDAHMPDSPFTSGAGRILIEAPYRRNVQANEVEPLFSLCEQWIDAIATGNRRPIP